jgi:hypothetical protein
MWIWTFLAADKAHYGMWDRNGIWQFDTDYRLIAEMLGDWKVTRVDYADHKSHREAGQPYFGPVDHGKPVFGTRGRIHTEIQR